MVDLMNKKVVVLGGGTGMSSLIKGLKNFPVDISAIVSVSDDGKSTGRLREEFGIPAVGDVRKVLVALSNTKETLFEELLDYRFATSSGLNGHTIGNLLLTAATNTCGNMSEGIELLSKLLNLKGKVIPLTEDNVTLMAQMKDGSIIEGEHNITEANNKIEYVYYKKEPIVNLVATNASSEADLVVLSMGSLYTSIIPNLLCPEIIESLDNSKAPILYACNMMTQPGETDDFAVSDHVNLLNQYLGTKKISVVVANSAVIDEPSRKKYESTEQKDQVLLDLEKLTDVKVIANNYFIVENELIRHNSLKVASDIFTYMLFNMEQEKDNEKVKQYLYHRKK